MGTTAALSIEYREVKHSGVILWTLRDTELRRGIARNGAESNRRKAKKAAEHAMRMYANQQKEK